MTVWLDFRMWLHCLPIFIMNPLIYSLCWHADSNDGKEANEKLNSLVPGQNGYILRTKFVNETFGRGFRVVIQIISPRFSATYQMMTLSIGAGTVLSGIREQAITWVYADPVHWYISVSYDHIIDGGVTLVYINGFIQLSSFIFF